MPEAKFAMTLMILTREMTFARMGAGCRRSLADRRPSIIWSIGERRLRCSGCSPAVRASWSPVNERRSSCKPEPYV